MKKIILILQILLVFVGCEGLFRKDDELSFVKTPNTTDKIRLDGYYYWWHIEPKYKYVGVNVFYQNGVAFSFGLSDSTDNFENELLMGNLTFNSKLHWGLYYIREDSLLKNGFGVLAGTHYISEVFSKYVILNDTTILLKEKRFADGSIDYYNDTLHFKQFSPKPDSTNIYIK
ncbi:hypothetical protein MASR2M117_06820 [Paludibacter sp.]